MTTIDPRKFVTFFKSKTGRITAFGILFFISATAPDRSALFPARHHHNHAGSRA